MDAISFLQKKATPRHAIYALVGDEEWLRRKSRRRIVQTFLSSEEEDGGLSIFSGESIDFSTVRNELYTRPMLASCRVVVVESADRFITEHRSALEQLAAQPPRAGVLVLEAKTFPETTRLAKAMPDTAKVVCKAPPAYRLPEWCRQWASLAYGLSLTAEAAELLVELAGEELGLLDQELAKLAAAVGDKTVVDVEHVRRYVSRSREADVFRIMEAIGAGQPAEAIRILEELLAAGEDPLAVLGPLSAQLRKLAMVAREVAAGQTLSAAMDAAGIPTWPKARQAAEQQLRHLGRRRLDRLSQWLVELNAGLKGANPLPERVQLERFIVQLARPREDLPGALPPVGAPRS